jgi:hypothetical protein
VTPRDTGHLKSVGLGTRSQLLGRRATFECAAAFVNDGGEVRNAALSIRAVSIDARLEVGLKEH